MFETFIKLALAICIVCLIGMCVTGDLGPILVAAAVVWALYHVANGFSQSD